MRQWSGCLRDVAAQTGRKSIASFPSFAGLSSVVAVILLLFVRGRSARGNLQQNLPVVQRPDLPGLILDDVGFAGDSAFAEGASSSSGRGWADSRLAGPTTCASPNLPSSMVMGTLVERRPLGHRHPVLLEGDFHQPDHRRSHFQPTVSRRIRTPKQPRSPQRPSQQVSPKNQAQATGRTRRRSRQNQIRPSKKTLNNSPNLALSSCEIWPLPRFMQQTKHRDVA